MKINLALSLAATVLLVGCAGSYSASRIAVLQHPETKQTVECKVNPWGDTNNRRQIDYCISTYEKAGYVKVGDSAD